MLKFLKPWKFSQQTPAIWRPNSQLRSTEVGEIVEEKEKTEFFDSSNSLNPRVLNSLGSFSIWKAFNLSLFLYI